ncbi:MAG: hypothetical protein KUG68_09900 [Flavobacteriaceae bacterium]|nr:hypothetical protein [Flavobacteriaceae bacterium]
MNHTPLGKNIAIIAYITFIGTVIAYIMNVDHKHEFANFHIKNMFGLILLMFLSQVTQASVSLLLGEILFVIAFFLWAYSIVMAITNQKKGVPFLDEKFQEWFKFLD